MQTPIEIAFQHCEPNAEIRAEVVRQAQRLERFSDCITSCHVVVVAPSLRRRTGALYRVDVRVALPAGKEVVVDRPHGEKREHEHVEVAIRDAFEAAARQVEDAMRNLRGQVKSHAVAAAADHGRVTKFLAGEDCGFIETADGREVYFHRSAVADGAFDRLRVGSDVRFVEKAGEKGPHASAVRLLG